MAFDVAGDAYDRFMGVYSRRLSPLMCDAAGVAAGSGLRVADVGCGPGILSEELVRRLGAGAVVAADPSEPFVLEARRRLPEVDVVQAPAETLPWADDSVDAALAQLVVQFMSDPVGGLREMARVTRPGGVVAASVWDSDGGRSPLSLFWTAMRATDPSVVDESGRPGAGEGRLRALFTQAGLTDVAEGELTVTRDFSGFDEWWALYQLGVGPPGDAVRSLDEAGRTRLEGACRDVVPAGPFTLTATAWAARGVVAG